ncbi:NH(3)-dependent NAD(+) synthetase [Bacteroidia bacterium]|nr:NH(3)-dependent NAD(+) synthetase [Bacteroidia bacterium]
MNHQKVIDHIVRWMDAYAEQAGIRGGFVIGVSGGIDSALSSTLAVMTGRPTLCVTLPIHQAASQVDRAGEHIEWLSALGENVSSVNVDLTGAYQSFVESFATAAGSAVTRAAKAAGVGSIKTARAAARSKCGEAISSRELALACANTRSRLRMTALYHLAGLRQALVVGTGNKIEDYAIGFFTKYGDGGVDLSPIADLTKSEVYALAAELGICRSICLAPPTDGLFGDNRTDEDQIGASYPELEWAMEQTERGVRPEDCDGHQREVMEIYLQRNRANRHKMEPIPVCHIPDGLR